jgi:hypothetical protein
MRLVLVHGIKQEGKDPEVLRRTWVEDLERGLGRPGALAGVEVVMPFYGDVLSERSNAKAGGAIAQGGNTADDQALAEFLSAGLEEQADAEQIPAAEIRAEQERLATKEPTLKAVEQGFPMDRRINAIVSLLERISPARGDLAVRLLGQAHAYLNKPGVAPAVDDLVRPALADGPVVLVTHSLGTVVSFKLLRELAQAGTPVQVPLYVTLGTPLTLSTVQRALGPSFATPDHVGHWINLRDPDDFISLNRDLGAPRFSATIENIGDFENPGDDAHAIPGYLTNPTVAQAVADALGL